MSSSTRKMLKNMFTSYGGCGCGKPRAKEIFEPQPMAKAPSFDDHHHQKPGLYHSSSSSWERGGGISMDDDDYMTSTTFSEHDHHNNTPSSSEAVTPFPRFGDSVAIVKDSEDPYRDFRQSMLQMILEKEIYSKDGLQELLNCFLQLNSSSHHKIIVQAFMDIWNGVVSKKPRDHQQNQNDLS